MASKPGSKGELEVRPDGDRFGELAVALGLATVEQVQEALRKQAGAEGLKLGELLVEARVIDLRRVQKVLLEQTRKRKAAGKELSTTGAGKRVGDYELLAKLGEGGMGAVYRARDTSMDRIVALKVLGQGLTGNPKFVERFRREAKATGLLNHPNIVAAYGAGEADGAHYLAMEFVDGESLRQRLKKVGKFPEREALEIVRKCAAGLGHAHENNLIHRDIKPDNVLLGKKGEVKIVDLGLAKAVDDDQRLTKTGTAIGTPHYISPEQARGDSGVDHRSDIYSLGATLYALLTGQTPFQGKNNNEIMLKHLKEELENPQDIVPEISDAAVGVVSKMMAKDPDDRYADCKQVIADIDQALKGQALSQGEVEITRTSIRPPRRKRRRPAAKAKGSGGGCLVVLAVFLGAPLSAGAALLLGLT
ncbi:MAG: serine/threonine protein kinase [Planctomycetes bacterium]|nr:serine/threonine protein kinase [Planctomycetota bacterium]